MVLQYGRVSDRSNPDALAKPKSPFLRQNGYISWMALMGLLLVFITGCSKDEAFPLRRSVKVILLNEHNELLLMSSYDPKTTSMKGSSPAKFWSLIGGAIENTETLEEAAVREVFEETGLRQNEFTFGPVVWHGEFDLILGGVPTHIDQTFIVAHTLQNHVSLEHLTTDEKKIVKQLSWFSIEKIRNSEDAIYPVVLSDYLQDIIDEKYPQNVLELDLAKRPIKNQSKE